MIMIKLIMVQDELSGTASVKLSRVEWVCISYVRRKASSWPWHFKVRAMLQKMSQWHFQ